MTVTAASSESGPTAAPIDRLAPIVRDPMRRLATTAFRGPRVRGVKGTVTRDRRGSTAGSATVVVFAATIAMTIWCPEMVGQRVSTTVQGMLAARALMAGATSGVMTGRLMIGVMIGRLVMTGPRLGPADRETLAARAAMTGVMIARFVMIGRDSPAGRAMDTLLAAMTGVMIARFVMIGRDRPADRAIDTPRAATTVVTSVVTTAVLNRLTTRAMTAPVVQVGRRLDPDSGMVSWARAAMTAVISGRPAMLGRRVRTASRGVIGARSGMNVVPRLAKDAVTNGVRTGPSPVPTVAVLDRLAMIALRGSSGGLSRIVSGAHRSAEI